MAKTRAPAAAASPSPVRRRGKLWVKFLVYFLVASLVPLGAVGFLLNRTTRESLKRDTLNAQQARAISFANFVNDYITTYKNVLFEVAHMDGFLGMSPAEKESTFNRLMQLHPPLLELSFINISGKEVVRLSRFQRDKTAKFRDFGQNRAFLRALKDGEYLGDLTRYDDIYPTMMISLPIVDANGRDANGVLLGKINLNGLSQMLQQWFKDSAIEGALVGPEGFLIAHSDLNKVFRSDARMPQPVLDVILTRPEEKGGGEIQLTSSQVMLGTFSTVKNLGWVVYVQQPLETAYATANAMEGEILKALLWVVLGSLILSFFFSGQLTDPIRTLKEAVGKLAAGEYESIEVSTTNDELGELAMSFLEMADSIQAKTSEILTAKQEVERLNRTLENRVEARTRELKAAQEELLAKARLAAIGQMASVVGHEIRNPLAVINNSVYFIKTKLSNAGELDPKIGKHLSIIESEIQQANGIINEILTFSRTRELKPAVHAINDFLEELVSIYPFPSHIQVVKDFAPENPNVFIDPDEMRQALRNLIGNGVEVMPNGGVLKVATQIMPQMKDWIRIDVSDSGGGIPQDVIEKIFAPFFTTKARGTGLGLAVVRKVVDRHKGKVEVESTVGQGTTFKIWLPLATKIGPSLSTPASAVQPAPPSGVGPA
jgi:signal transduction histidine kinase